MTELSLKKSSFVEQLLHRMDGFRTSEHHDTVPGVDHGVPLRDLAHVVLEKRSHDGPFRETEILEGLPDDL